jgi:hypothetical protein
VALGRLVLAWVVVAVWFGIATFATTYLVARMAVPSEPDVYANVPLRLLQWRLIEATLLTLLASLWFDSLGSGGWWLLFLLLGALATLPQWFRASPSEDPRRALIAGGIADLCRYVVAGAVLAWRLA